MANTQFNPYNNLLLIMLVEEPEGDNFVRKIHTTEQIINALNNRANCYIGSGCWLRMRSLAGDV